MFVQLNKSDRADKKYMAIFYDDDRNKKKTTHFGQAGASDFTKNKDEERKQRYLDRHTKDDWNNYMSAGSLARWLLWNKPTLSASYNDYLRKFNLKKY